VTADQIELVRKSFDELWPVRRKLAELFYSRFFELAPDSRRLFPDSMEKQNLKLMDEHVVRHNPEQDGPRQKWLKEWTHQGNPRLARTPSI
jgi:hypothetical protein